MARVRRTGTLAALLLAISLTAGCGSGMFGGHSVPSAHPAPADSAANRVGALFLGQLGGPRLCTASVVHSPKRNLLVTAAHCVHLPGQDPTAHLIFAPGYRNGQAPYGTWPVKAITVDPRWQDGQDPEYDVAFIGVGAVDGKQIEDVVGGNSVATGEGFGLHVSVTGYPNDSEVPITCSNQTSAQSPTQERFDCSGYTDGTSGSPWLGPNGEVVGVIGGYEAGGDTDSTSYSITFDARVSVLFHQATA